ncbi:hypothetical protein QFC21_002228 [Naganishia friedmannii]|uniref:Uncharacterized protein n=1 Tax=Naganishia friedmannii TaxID=89922 RepID=A0ACC2VYP8_9TREE|nr:hypothetical protein QFC21_002228 [Naganishia friedmannii]
MRLPILGLALSSLLAGQSMAMPAARNNGKAIGHHKAGDPTTYSACQMPKAQGEQLNGCPTGTLYVSQTDPQAGYGSIQSAISSLPNDTSSHVILVGPGSYHEVLNVGRQGPLYLLGITDNPNKYESNLVHVWNSSFINQTTQTATQHNSDAVVLTVAPGKAGVLAGAGIANSSSTVFGCSDFRVYNIDFANRATVNGVEIIGRQTGPSAALYTSYANTSFYGSNFASYQDSVFIGSGASAFFFGGMVKGFTDYLYGYGTACSIALILLHWDRFECVTMANRGCGGGITAWKGTGTPALSCPLGRPWNNASRSIYKNTYMSDIVLPQGFIAWSDKDPRVVPNLTVFGEYGSYGPGWNAAARNTSVETVLSKEQADKYTVETVFGGMPSWIDLGTAVIS